MDRFHLWVQKEYVAVREQCFEDLTAAILRLVRLKGLDLAQMAEDLGRAAHKAGQKCIPHHSQELREFCQEYCTPKIGCKLRKVITEAWMQGWHRKNLNK